MSFPRYPTYKASGVEWLGEVPEHWDVKPLKRVATIQTGLAKGKEVNPEHCVEVPFLRVANVQDGFLDLEQVHTIQIPERSLNRYLLQYGDVLMNEGGDFDKLGRGAIWSGEIELCIHQNHVFAVRPHSVRTSWLNAYTSSKPANSYFISRSKQSTNLASISSSNLMELSVPVAPEDETTQILGFLDRETANINALITEQERLIELLQEKRQAVISQAVTKGLNPSAPMKDSGVEWLDEVPKHWRVLPVWILFRLGRGRVISHEDIQKDPGDYPIYSSQTENNGEMGKIGTFDFDGDYLTWTTDGANAGTVFKRNGKFNCTNVCGTLKAKYTEQINLDFALLALRLATSSYVRMDINPKLMNNVMASIRIPIPSINEQESIVHFLNKELSGFDPLEATIDEQVLLLKERRSALISAAVTGQIDVRHLASKGDAA